MSILTKQQMEKLNTRRLLRYKRRVLSYVFSRGDYDLVDETEKKYLDAYKDAKEILATREHIK